MILETVIRALREHPNPQPITLFLSRSIPFVTRVPLADALTVIGTSVFATKYGLAQALVGGVLLSALRYAWEVSTQRAPRVVMTLLANLL